MERRSSRRRASCFLSGLLLVSVTLGGSVGAAESLAVEHAVKAGFLFNFIKFTSWPPEVLDEPQETLRVCVVGTSTLGEVLTPFEARRVQGHRLEIVRIEAQEELVGCHVLYLALENVRKLDAFLPWLDGSGVLTVGDLEGFARRGGMIGFVERNGRLAFEINLDAVERSGLHISSNLLELASMVWRETP